MPNILNPADRKVILDQIRGDENRQRKNDSLKRYDVYQKRQHRYLREQLTREYSEQTVREMRLISSINLGRRIIDEKASLYVKPPKRNYSRAGKDTLTENETEQLRLLAKHGRLDEALKKSNRFYKLQNQCAIQVMPKHGVITSRVLLPHHYDVIPRDDDPSTAEAYVINVFDRSLLYNTTFASSSTEGSQYLSQNQSDQINQVIADSDDDKAGQQRNIWWSDEYNFITDGKGNLIDEVGNPLEIRTVQDLQMIANPIGRLPFVDVATEKEFEFWVRLGNDVVDFALDFSVLLSDTAEINKRQGYSQAIVYSEEAPKDMLIGPHRVLHMKQDPNKESQPRFEWATPSPDMQASLELLRTYLTLFLTSEGMDPKTVAATADGNNFSSGVERLLAMIDKFEASADDIALFHRVEQETLDIMVMWSNLLQGATLDGGIEPLIPALQQAALPDDLEVVVVYEAPAAIQTATEVEDSVIKRMENRLMSRKEAMMKLDGISEQEAEKRIKQIDEDDDMDSVSVSGPPVVLPKVSDVPDPESKV